MKTNFKKTDTGDYKKYDEYDEIKNNSSELTQEEFEEFIVKSGAKGSFMVYRTDKKAIIFAKSVEKQSKIYKSQLKECQKSLDKKRYIIF